jgi:hypothetical protein
MQSRLGRLFREYVAIGADAFRDQRGVFAMSTQGPSSIFNLSIPSVSQLVPPIQIADVSFTTSLVLGAVQTLSVPCTKFQVVIYLKTYVVGTTAITGGGPIVGPLFYLEGADVVGMTTNRTVIGEMVQAPNIASATLTGGLVLFIRSLTPVAAKQFVRIVVDPTLQTGAVAGTYDAVILAE